MSRPHRIAFGITELDPGGAERMLTELVTRLDRTEWEPRVYCLGPEAHYAQVLRDRDVPVMCFDARGWLSAPRVLREWTRELKQFQPEILYGWLFHASLLGRIAGRRARVPHILSGIRVAERRNKWHGRLDRWTNHLVDLNVCVSRGVADFVEQQWDLDPAKTVVIPNAIDPEPYRQATPADLTQFGIPVGNRVLITVGRLEHQKGIDVLLDAAAMVVKQVPEAHFLIVGDGHDREKLERQAVQLKLSQNIHWAGRRSDIPKLLAASEALVLPSRWEGMPNIVLEAMAAAKPVIATEAEGVSELVQPGLNGWVVSKGNPQKLADAVLQMLADPNAIRQMGYASQDVVSKGFTLNNLIENHTRIWRMTILKAQPTPETTI